MPRLMIDIANMLRLKLIFRWLYPSSSLAHQNAVPISRYLAPYAHTQLIATQPCPACPSACLSCTLPAAAAALPLWRPNRTLALPLPRLLHREASFLVNSNLGENSTASEVWPHKKGGLNGVPGVVLFRQGTRITRQTRSSDILLC